MYTAEEAYEAMEPFFQAQQEAQRKICCWKDPNVAAVEAWLQTVIAYSRVCFEYDGTEHGQSEVSYREECHAWIKEYTQLNCKVHREEMV